MKMKTQIQSFRPTHVLAYKSAGNQIDRNTNLDDIIEFMKLQKQAANLKRNSNKRKADDQPGGKDKGRKKNIKMYSKDKKEKNQQ